MTDPLQTVDRRSDRLHYSTGELLGADDFRDEQTYHRRQMALALLHLHGSGTIAGLRVAISHRVPAGGREEVEIRVHPGLAVDHAGRLIEVPLEACLRLRRWYEFIASPDRRTTETAARHLRAAWRPDAVLAAGGAVVADVFLAFHACPRGYTPAFASGPFDALDASQPSRIRDAFELSLVLRSERDEDLPAASEPWSVPAGDTVEARLADAEEASRASSYTTAHASPENPPDVDPTAVLLARLRLPASENPDVNQAPLPVWSADAWAGDSANVDNRVRRVVLPPAVMRRVIAP